MKSPKNIKIGLIGFGNVGQGVYRILMENQETIVGRVGHRVDVARIAVRDLKKYEGVEVGASVLTTNVKDLLDDPEIDIVVEVMGGEKPAFEYISGALKRKKFVVTANKEVISKHKETFFQLARDNDVDIYFEASVGGGIPIIRSFKVGYSANQIQSIDAILNGTTNYILTKIQDDNIDFGEALRQAQDKGFAEAEPSMDISGLDAAYKLVILASVAFKVDIQLDDVPYEGIEGIALKDMLYALELGYTVKLIASGRFVGPGEMTFKVHPTMVPLTHPLASVRNEFNAIFSVGNAMGESMIYGKGAGSFPTGSAVVSDILDICFDRDHQNARISRRNLEAGCKPVKLRKMENTQSKFFLRLILEDRYGVLEKIMSVFGEHKVSVLKLLQKDILDEDAEVVIVTHKVREKDMQSAIKELEGLREVRSVLSVIRVGLDEFHPQGLFGV